ncbi:MAG: hypothetical protein GF317_17415 [Candidatus Lokiarchaeota archaeon]|nr:hypothetical protein [Candidatus Lokiarchaeota archaeon]MBD3201299.1 hypothetical protein [Candidatus Lokiarchaeota archaeon]
MEKKYILKIGSKGEIFTPKEVREELGLTKDEPIIMRVYPNRIVIQKIESLKKLLKEPSDIKISYHVMKNIESEFD